MSPRSSGSGISVGFGGGAHAPLEFARGVCSTVAVVNAAAGAKPPGRETSASRPHSGKDETPSSVVDGEVSHARTLSAIRKISNAGRDYPLQRCAAGATACTPQSKGRWVTAAGSDFDAAHGFSRAAGSDFHAARAVSRAAGSNFSSAEAVSRVAQSNFPGAEAVSRVAEAFSRTAETSSRGAETSSRGAEAFSRSAGTVSTTAEALSTRAEAISTRGERVSTTAAALSTGASALTAGRMPTLPGAVASGSTPL